MFNSFKAIAKLPKDTPADLTAEELTRVKLLGAYGYVAGLHAKKGVDKTRSHLNQTIYELADTSDLQNPHEKAELLTDAHLIELKQRGIKVRKDNTLLLGFVGSLDDEKLRYIAHDKINDYLDSYFVAVQRYFAAHAPDSIITTAFTHHDQSKPHIHVYAIPIKDGRLAASSLLGKRKQIHDFHEWFEVELKRIYKQKGLPAIPYQRTNLQDKKAKELKQLQAQNRIKNKRLSQSQSKQKQRLKQAIKQPSYFEILTQRMNGAKPEKPLATRGKRLKELTEIVPTSKPVATKKTKAKQRKSRAIKSVSATRVKPKSTAKVIPRCNAPPPFVNTT